MNNSFYVLLKRNSLSMFPIVLLILLLSIIFQINISLILQFIISSFLIILGVTFYLVGFDLSYPKVSDRITHVLIKKKNIIYILGICLFLGCMVSLFAKEIIEVSNMKFSLLVLLSFSIGFFFMLSIFRILTKTNFKIYLIISYIVIFILMIKSDFLVVPFALDRAALGTGAVSAPFLLTLGMSFSKRNRKVNKEYTSFGILGLSAVGPIIVFLILGIYSNVNFAVNNLSLFKSILYLFFSLIPIVIVYFIFLRFDLKRYKKEIKEVLRGFLYVFLGIVLSFLGANYGCLPMASIIGEKLSLISFPIILLIGGILGFLIPKIEPSFVFLMEYVNLVTSEGIKEKFLEFFLCLGVAFSFLITIVIVYYHLNIIEFLITSFFLAILIAFFTPNTFLSIAFDSLGAVIGTISSSFFLPFLVSLSKGFEGITILNTFGFLAFIGIVPVIFLELAGFIYEQEINMHDYNHFDDRIVDYD